MPLLTLAVILFRTHFFQPGYHLAVHFFLYRYMAHRFARRGAVPMPLIGLKINYVARLYFLDVFAVFLYPTKSGYYNKRLTRGVRVPCRSCARFKSNQCARGPG